MDTIRTSLAGACVALILAIAGCGPGVFDPNTLDPNAADPNTLDPNTTDPNAVEPNQTDPNAAPPPQGGDQLPVAPESLAFDNQGNLYVASEFVGVYRRQADGEYVQLISNDDNALDSLDKIRFVNNSLYVFTMTQTNPAVYRYDPSGQLAAAVFDPNDARRLGATLAEDVAVAPDGRVYLAMYYEDIFSEEPRVYRYGPDGEAESAVVLYDEGDIGTVTALAVDPNGNLYVADPSNIAKFDPDGNLIAVLAETGDHGLDYPREMTADSAGNLYVWNNVTTDDGTRSSILQFNPDGEFVAEALPLGAADQAGLSNYPSDLLIGPNGQLLIVDLRGDVFEVTSNGQLETYLDYPQNDNAKTVDRESIEADRERELKTRDAQQ
ncbi:MAG: hypothetical protein GXY33_09420 [Phycisphaerae bacterium]|nr:hypothetical protein [Phycisphaerae bacterium]